MVEDAGAPGGTLAHPLAELYERARLAPPAVEEISERMLPALCRRLLAESDAMTATLERHHGRRVRLEVLRARRDRSLYCRQVVLVCGGCATPVVLAAVKLDLARFPLAARRQILAGRRPLGRIVRDVAPRHSVRSRAFLRVPADAVIRSALRLPHAPTLYGRRRTIFDAVARPAAEIVEILGRVRPLHRSSAADGATRSTSR